MVPRWILLPLLLLRAFLVAELVRF